VKTCVDRDLEILAPLNLEDDTFIRSSLVAGRSQAFYGRQKFNFKVQAKDVCSLYPYIMINRQFPDCSEAYIKTDIYMKDKLGIYKVKIIHQNMNWFDEIVIQKQANKLMEIMKQAKKIEEEKALINNTEVNNSPLPELATEFAPVVFPKRSEDVAVPLDWNNRGSFECTMTNIDIECIRDNGGEVEVYDGIYWENTRDDIFDYLKDLETEKNRQDILKNEDEKHYNESLREMCKLFSNSLSGKVIQRNFDDDSKMIQSSTDLAKFRSGIKPDTLYLEQLSKNLIIANGKKLDSRKVGKILNRVI